MDIQTKQGLIKQIKDHLINKINEFINKNSFVNQSKIILIGDSLIEYLKEANYLEYDYLLLNRGISGLTSKALYNNLDDILGDLSLIGLFISIGANDFVVDNLSFEESTYYINLILDKLNNKYPNIPKYFLSFTPIISETNLNYQRPHLFGRKKANIIKLNNNLIKLVNNKGYEFIDVYHDLLDKDNDLNELYTYDGIHLNNLGYQIYTKKINKIIIEKLNEGWEK